MHQNVSFYRFTHICSGPLSTMFLFYFVPTILVTYGHATKLHVTQNQQVGELHQILDVPLQKKCLVVTIKMFRYRLSILKSSMQYEMLKMLTGLSNNKY